MQLQEDTLNPANPRDRASDWEADLVGKFRQDPGAPKECWADATRRPAGPSISRRPIQVKSESCLSCHSTVDAAPKTMLDHYGNANGFGWKLNEIVERPDHVGAHRGADPARQRRLQRCSCSRSPASSPSSSSPRST